MSGLRSCTKHGVREGNKPGPGSLQSRLRGMTYNLPKGTLYQHMNLDFNGGPAEL